MWITGLDGVNDLGDFAHEARPVFSLRNSSDIRPAVNLTVNPKREILS
jgi:hypothetical protein